jgi:hypothetical protein
MPNLIAWPRTPFAIRHKASPDVLCPACGLGLPGVKTKTIVISDADLRVRVLGLRGDQFTRRDR